jgi:hypothetical protein
MAVSKVRTSAGTTLSVSPNAPATYDLTGFTALTFTTVGELSDLGSFGKKYNLVTFNPLGDRKTVKRKGSYNNGTLALKLGSSPTDAGQVIMEAGSNSDNSYSFLVTTQSGSTYYFSGQIMGWMLEVGSVDQIMGASADLEIDNDIVKGTLFA